MKLVQCTVSGTNFVYIVFLSQKIEGYNHNSILPLQPPNFSIFAMTNKMPSNFMKTHFASALAQQCFYRGWWDFILRASAFTWSTSAKTLTRSKLVSLFGIK